MKKNSTFFFHSNYPFLNSSSIADKVKLLLTRFSNRGRHPIVVSRVVKDAVDSALQIDSVVLFNIINCPIEAAAVPLTISEFGSAGRFDPEKRFIQLIDAFPKSCALSLHFAGDGLLLQTAIEYKRKKDHSNVFFHGQKLIMKEFYEKVHAYICCSEFEGFGLAIGEAMCFGRLIISTEVGFLKEDIPFQFLRVNSDLSNLKERIAEAAKIKYEDIIGMTQKNRQLILENFGASSIYKRYKTLLLGTE